MAPFGILKTCLLSLLIDVSCEVPFSFVALKSPGWKPVLRTQGGLIIVSSLKYLFLVMVFPASGIFLRTSDDTGPVRDVISKIMGDIQVP